MTGWEGFFLACSFKGLHLEKELAVNAIVFTIEPMDKQSSKSPTPGGSGLSEEKIMQVNTTTVNNTHAVVIRIDGVEYLYASNSSAHVCSATAAAAARDFARHGDASVFINGLPVVQKRINRHGRVVRFTA